MTSTEMNLNAWPVREVRSILLTDRATRKNIIFATDSYADKGPEYGAKNHITAKALQVLDIRSRVLKNSEEQQLRTRKKAEVFTPAWMCCMMNNHADTVWFGKEDVFGHLEGTEWVPSTEPVQFPKRKKWQSYVDARWLEITCGEAPYLTSRYDMGTGEMIQIVQRIGILDRKLRIVSENAQDEAEWLKWAIRSLQAVYGYEYQGDNLLIARVNLLLTFAECLQEHLQRDATRKELREAARIISWNIWQMDGLKGTIPMGTLYEQNHQMSLFEMEHAEMDRQDDATDSIPCRIYNWRSKKKSVEFNAFRGGRNGTMKYDFIIGNPPYQEETESESTRMPPIYNNFMDETYEIADIVELITPARFLFNAGQTSKAWNQKMLEDPHLQVVFFEPVATKIFPNTDIKGGVAVTYRNSKIECGPIRAFVPYEELRSILNKAGAKDVADSLTDIADSSNVYDLNSIYADHPDYRQYVGDGGRHSQLKTNVLNINPIFTNAPTSDDDYAVYGLVDGKRGNKYCHSRYLKSDHKSLFKHKVLVPKATGSGKFGDPLPDLIILKPREAFTQTYISIGTFDTQVEAINLSKYLKTKLCRSLLYVLKVTQDNLPAVWRFIPKQDFTPNSDINWSASIKAIDQQLYKKYGLSEKEISFIETHVKEMS